MADSEDATVETEAPKETTTTIEESTETTPTTTDPPPKAVPENLVEVTDVPPDTLTSDGPDDSMEIDAPPDISKEEDSQMDTEESVSQPEVESSQEKSTVDAESQQSEVDSAAAVEKEKEDQEIDQKEVEDVEIVEPKAEEDASDEDDEEVESQKSADEIIQTTIDAAHDDEESETEGIMHLSKEENELLNEEHDSAETWKSSDKGKDGTETSDGAPAWTQGLTQDDIDQIYKLGSLTKAEVIAEVKKLYDQSYKLGVQEAKEMTRGRYLNIFSSKKKP